MLFKEIIRHKRDGGELDAAQLSRFVDGLSDGSLPAEQVAAMAMAMLLRSLTCTETGLLTRAMAGSGEVLSWSGDSPVIDKHSTGGVGDKVSLVLAPVAAACGCRVPMISGRGLGHTGGTLDKMDSIPGYNTSPSLARLREVVNTIGCAIIGQTPELAPADRRLYAIRDVTGTVESIPLITASILSKKIAAGNQALVMDIKTGGGAFMRSRNEALQLADSIVGTAGSLGLPVSALLTDMNQPLGLSVGNALEVIEAIDYLRGEQREARFDDVVLSLASEMLLLGGIEQDAALARKRAENTLRTGAAAEVFNRMVAALGGPTDIIGTDRGRLPEATYQQAILAPAPGYLAGIDTRAVGNALIGLGGGRNNIDDQLDFTVGFSNIAPLGTEVDDRDRPLAVVHATGPDTAARAAAAYIEACQFSDTPPVAGPVVIGRAG